MASTTIEARRLLVTALRTLGIHAYEETTGKYTVHAFTTNAGFKLSFMPGNRRTLISHGVYVDPLWQRQGIGTEMCRLREKAALEAGVTLLLATVMDSNWSEIRVLEKCNWVRLTQNTKTHCSLWGKQI